LNSSRGGDELGTDGNQEFFPQLIRLAANERHSPARTATRNWGDAIKAQRLLNSSWPSRGDPFPPVLVMEAAEHHASHNLAVLGKGMFVVTLQRWEYRGTFRNPRSEAQMRALGLSSGMVCREYENSGADKRERK
jgi:hypothetical protein